MNTNKSILKKFEGLREVLPSSSLAISPLDGRYSKIGEDLSPYFSEVALMQNRVKVEVFWLKYLLENIREPKILDKFDKAKIPQIMSIYDNFSGEDFLRIKEIESVTNHDVKAVELFVAEKLKGLNMGELVSFVHIGCTSEDINNTSYANMVGSAMRDVWLPTAQKVIDSLVAMADKYADVPMLAHTHGQPATPTTVGKEFAVYVKRLYEQLKYISKIQPKAKFNGATGNYSAISVAFPNEDWRAHSKRFVEDYLGLTFNPVSTQIEDHGYMANLFDAVKDFNLVLEDLSLDMWLYISMEYFKQIPVKNEVGSSTMPHKVNPIRFENAEANIEQSNASFVGLANKLLRSRMQRDLSDSSTQRYIGTALGCSVQAMEQIVGGLAKVALNEEKIASELENNWEVLAEPIQTVLRRNGNPEAYNQLKELTRGRQVTATDIETFIAGSPDLTEQDRQVLGGLTPSTYIGEASSIAKDVVKEVKSK